MPNQGILFGRDARPSANARMAQTVGRQTLPLQIQPIAAVHRAYVRIRRYERNMARINPLTPADTLEFDQYCANLGIELVPSVSTFGHQYVAMRTQELRELGEFPEDADRPFSFIERMRHHTLNVADDRLRILCATGRLVSATFPFEAIQHLRRRNLRPRQRQVEAGSATRGRRSAVRNIRGQTLRTPV